MADYPAEVKTFRLIGRLGRGVGDTLDVGTRPDLIPLVGARIICTPDLLPPVFKSPLSDPPVTIFQESIVGTTNLNGEVVAGTLSTDGKTITALPNGQVGIELPYGSSPGIQPSGWTWTVYVSVGGNFPDRKFTVAGTPDGTLDLATLIPVPAAPGEELVAWQNAVNTTLGYRDAAATYAAEAKDHSEEAIAGTTDIRNGGRLGPLPKGIDNQDVNNVLDTGFYSGAGLKNAPEATGGYYYLKVHRHANPDAYLQQTITRYADGEFTGNTWVRYREGGTSNWSAWAKTNDPIGAIDNTLRNILNPAQRIGPKSMLKSNTDLNLLFDNGWYGGDALTNAPGNDKGFFYIQVQRSFDASAYAWQIATRAGVGVGGVGVVYQRFAEGAASGSTAWSPWVRVTDIKGALDQSVRDDLAKRLGTNVFDYSGSDFNTIQQTGFYRGNSMINAPLGSTGWFYIMVQSHDGTNWVQQTAIGYAVDSKSIKNTFTRQKENGNWSAWVQVADSSGGFDSVARSSISGTLGGGARLGGTLGYRSNVNVNDFRTSGWYTGVFTNAPTTATIALEVLAQENVWAVQRATAYTGADAGKVWIRSLQNDVWSAWIQVANVDGAYDGGLRGDINNRMRYVAMDLGAAKDLNTVTDSGWYLGGSGNPNSPFSGRWLMDVRSAGAGYVIQRFTSITGSPGTVWERYTNAGVANGSWSSWVQQTSKQYVDDRAGDKAPADNASAASGITLDGTASKTIRRTLTGNVTVSISGTAGASLSITNTLILIQDAPGGRTVTWPANIKWANGTKPSLSPAANAIDVVTILWTGQEFLGFLGGTSFA